MKVKVIGSTKEGRVIKGKVRIGQEVVMSHKGKVEIGIVVRTAWKTKTGMRFDEAAVMIKGAGSRAIGPISKGLSEEIIALSSSQL